MGEGGGYFLEPQNRGKVLHMSLVEIQASAYPGFRRMDISTPPWMGC